MPIYEHKCDECGAEREIILPFSEAGTTLVCECGREMRRTYSLSHFSIQETGRDKVLGILNREEGAQTYPGGEKHGARYDQAMAKGLERHGQPGQYKSGVSATSRG